MYAKPIKLSIKESTHLNQAISKIKISANTFFGMCEFCPQGYSAGNHECLIIELSFESAD